MFSKSKKDNKEKALVRQDPRTSVKTTSAETQTTNTTLQYATIVDSNRNKVIYQTTKQTITHLQKAHETELTIRRTPTKEELEEMLQKANFGQSFFRHDSPTLVNTQQTSVTQNVGSKVTSHVQQQRIKFDANNIKLSSPNSPLTPKYSYKMDARPFNEKPRAIMPLYNSASNNVNASPKLSTFTSVTPVGTSSKPQPTIAKAEPKSTSLFSWKSNTKLKPAVAFIFNHEIFNNEKNEYRVGSSEDVKSLKNVFKTYNINVTTIQDANLSQIKNTAKKFEKNDYSSQSAIIIVILSHGSQRDVIAAKDTDYNIDETILFPLLRNKTLTDKPKLLFIQACKGSIHIDKMQTDAVKLNASPNEVYKCYSTFEGYVAYRTEKGSVFIQTLCEVLEEKGKTTDIREVMDTVTLRVKEKMQNKQIPSVTSTLTKPYVFGDYIRN